MHIFKNWSRQIVRVVPIAVLALIIIMVLAIPVQATSVPGTINYQGYLTDSGGKAVNATLSMTFSIYDVPSGGSALWTETQSSVTVANGLFNVILGSVTNIDPAILKGSSYLGVKVGSDAEMTPRQQLTSVAYALRSYSSMDADKLGGKDASAYVLAGQAYVKSAGDTMTGLLLVQPASGDAIHGFTSSAIGVYGNSNTNTGVVGSSSSGNGIAAFSDSATNGSGLVAGNNHSGNYGHVGTLSEGVLGHSDSGDGVHGTSTSGSGVSGVTASGNGVYGEASINGGYGVAGRNTASGGDGVHGTSTSGSGVSGTTSTGNGVYGEAGSNGGVGVAGKNTHFGSFGQIGGFDGVYGESVNSTGIFGKSTNAYGVMGSGPTGVNGSGNIGVNAYGTTYDFYAEGPGANYGPFTGSHDVKLAADFPKDYKKGLIVSATGETLARTDDGETNFSSTLLTAHLAGQAKDKKVFGVLISEGPLPKGHWYQAKDGERFGIVNALGEGRVWVTNINGDIAAGDYITTSDISGYGQMQDDDLVHSYTLGKATENVDWSKVTDTIKFNGKIYKAYAIAVVYTSG